MDRNLHKRGRVISDPAVVFPFLRFSPLGLSNGFAGKYRPEMSHPPGSQNLKGQNHLSVCQLPHSMDVVFG
jgi:hypothetical protein